MRRGRAWVPTRETTKLPPLRGLRSERGVGHRDVWVGGVTTTGSQPNSGSSLANLSQRWTPPPPDGASSS